MVSSYDEKVRRPHESWIHEHQSLSVASVIVAVVGPSRDRYDLLPKDRSFLRLNKSSLRTTVRFLIHGRRARILGQILVRFWWDFGQILIRICADLGQILTTFGHLCRDGKMQFDSSTGTENNYRKTMYQKSHVVEHPVYWKPSCRRCQLRVP